MFFSACLLLAPGRHTCAANLEHKSCTGAGVRGSVCPAWVSFHAPLLLRAGGGAGSARPPWPAAPPRHAARPAVAGRDCAAECGRTVCVASCCCSRGCVSLVPLWSLLLLRFSWFAPYGRCFSELKASPNLARSLPFSSASPLTSVTCLAVVKHPACISVPLWPCMAPYLKKKKTPPSASTT